VSKGVIEGIEFVGAAVAAYFGYYQPALALLGAGVATDQARRAEEAAKRAYNASLRDRYAMIRNSLAPRQLVFGRARVSGPVFFASSYGDTRQHLAMCVALAAHEIDAVEAVYFDDKPVILDGSGNVVGVRNKDTFSIASATATVTLTDTPKAGSVIALARYGSTVVSLTVTSVSGVTVSVSGAHSSETGELDVYYQPDPDPYAPAPSGFLKLAYVITGASQTITVSGTPIVGTVYAAHQETSPGANDGNPLTVTSVSGTSVTVSGGTTGRTGLVYYQAYGPVSRARVRSYLGTSTQAADAELISKFPGVWTSAHRATGVAYLVVELDYDENAFPAGIPNVSAVIRGMKCYDPRTSTTAWTENPALHARALATHPLAGKLDPSLVDDAAVTLAANVCDTTTTYTVGGSDYTRAIYTAGYAFSVDRKPLDGLTDLCQAMGGDWAFADGVLKVSAGAYRTPVPLTLNETWLVDDSPVELQVGQARANLLNTITPSLADEEQDWQPVPLERISPSTYTSADGGILPQNVQFAAVTFGGQAQYIASCQLRRARQGLTFKAKCNLRAWQLERFDVINVTLSRFGWTNKPFEVMADTWTADGAIELTLRETAAAIWDMDAGFPAVDLAPNTSMPRPWGLPTVLGLAAESDDTTILVQQDGTVLPRMLVTWDAVTDERITIGGFIDIRYGRMGDAADTYQTVRVAGTETRAYLNGIHDAGYLVSARTVSTVTVSDWSPQVQCNTAGKTDPPSDVSGLAAVQTGGAVLVTWSLPTDADYATTELRRGTDWATGVPLTGASTPPTTIRGTLYHWAWPAFGSYTIWAKHHDSSGNVSATAHSASVTVNDGINIDTGRIVENAATDVYIATRVSSGSWASDE